MQGYSFFDHFLYRIPYFSNKREEDPNYFLGLKEFQESIYLASRPLYNSIFKSETISFTGLSSKQRNAIRKYIKRMSTRSTPFGNFASTGVGKFDKDSRVDINVDMHISGVTSIDIEFYILLSEALERVNELKEIIKFHPNPDIYRLKGNWRYVERKTLKEKASYHLAQVVDSRALASLLKNVDGSLSRDSLSSLLVEKNFCDDKQEAADFVQSLIENQVLVSEFRPGSTKNNLDFFENKLLEYRELIPEQLLNHFHFVKTALRELNKIGIGNRLAGIEKIEAEIHKFYSLKLSQGKSFTKTNIYCNTPDASLSEELLKLIKEGVRILNILTPTSVNSKIEIFKKRFKEVYENGPVPLMEVLDPVEGIGFETIRAENMLANPLSEGISTKRRAKIPLSDSSVSISSFLLNKYVEALKNGENVIHLKPSDFEGVEEKWDDLPLTFSVGAEIIRAGNIGDPSLYLKFAGGFSANALLGRFSSDSESIRKIIKKVKSFEQASFSDDIILAEISHIPENTMEAKVLTRDPIYDYEIPLMSASALNVNQVLASDLYLCIDDRNELILTSKKLKKQIVPRNSTAHSFHVSSHPIYHFLSVMQGNGATRTGLNINWGNFKPTDGVYPRVIYDNKIILFAARWEPDFSNMNISDFKKSLTEYKKKANIPDMIYVVKGFDNKLLIDLRSESDVDMLFEEIKRGGTYLEEYLACNDDPFIVSKEEFFNNEVILNLYRE